MALIVLLSDGTLRVYAELSSSLLSHWTLVHERSIGIASSCLVAFGGGFAIGDQKGEVHIFDAFDGKPRTIKVASNEPITFLKKEGDNVVVAHGIGTISILNDSSVKPAVKDDYVGICFAGVLDGEVVAVKYNQLYRGSTRTPLDIPEDEVLVAGQEIHGRIYLVGQSGSLYAVTGTKLDLVGKIDNCRGISLALSDTSLTAAVLGLTPNGDAKVWFCRISSGQPNLQASLCTLAWEAARYQLKSMPAIVRYRIGAAQSPKEEMLPRQLEVCREMADKTGWKAFERSLQGQTGWAVVGGMPVEECPDCKTAKVLFDSFTSAKCQQGHVLRRCSGTFKCLGTADPFEACEECHLRFTPSLFGRCPYCAGRLFLCK